MLGARALLLEHVDLGPRSRQPRVQRLEVRARAVALLRDRRDLGVGLVERRADRRGLGLRREPLRVEPVDVRERGVALRR